MTRGHMRVAVRIVAGLFYNMLITASSPEMRWDMISSSRSITVYTESFVMELHDRDPETLGREHRETTTMILYSILRAHKEHNDVGAAQMSLKATKLDTTSFAKLLIAKFRALPISEPAHLIQFLGDMFTHLKSRGSHDPFVIACLENGIIKAIIENLLVFAKEPTPFTSSVLQEVTSMLREIISKYTVWCGMLRVSKDVIDKLRSDSRYKGLIKELKIKDSDAGNAWVIFEDLIAERMLQTKGVFFDPAVCDNQKCRKLNADANFKKCSGCKVTLFCDEKSLGRMITKPNALCSGTVLPKPTNFQTIDAMVTNLDILRKQATDSFPDVPPKDLMVQIDFTVVPKPKLRVCHTSEFWATIKDHNHGLATKHSERHGDLSDVQIRAHPERHTISGGVLASGEESFSDTVVYSGSHWLLDKDFNGCGDMNVPYSVPRGSNLVTTSYERDDVGIKVRFIQDEYAKGLNLD
ncbi:hypothetical protein C8J56DRAFT_904419 [Mycena floridula]|nr:hypothetical protein C8J56DRAFT_904419 [Mycena floridula]